MDHTTKQQLMVFALVFWEGMKWGLMYLAIRWVWRKIKARRQHAAPTAETPVDRYCATRALPPDHPSRVWARNHAKSDPSPWRDE
jgi:hypothetical protein